MKKRFLTALLSILLVSSISTNIVNASIDSNYCESSLDSKIGIQDEQYVDLSEQDESETLTTEQNSSIAMLNYITTLTQEINASKNSRLYLEEVYSSLISNTNPNAVDYRTQGQLESLLDTLEDYRMLSVKRDRLQYIYEQNKAQAIREAVPNPVGLLSAASSGNWVKFALSVGYMAVDSYASYESASSEAEMKYLQDGWALDDEEASVLHNSRKSAFIYMLEMVRENNLPGNLALSEENVSEFVAWKNKTNVTQKIRFFESNESTYAMFGYYWLTLAENYFNNEDYQKCMDAVEKYLEIQPAIVRKDYDLAKVIPMAISSAKETLKGRSYNTYVEEKLDLLTKNIKNSDWSLRYFAALTYMDLYRVTKNEAHLDKAYNLTVDNVNSLVEEQRKKNSEYLGAIKEQEIPKDSTKEQKKEIKNYNKLLKEERKTALPPTYEPLVLNCDLLFALAEEKNIDVTAKNKINKMLHGNGEPLFLIEPLDQYYTMNSDSLLDIENAEFTFTGKEFTMPTSFVSDDATIKMIVDIDGTKTEITDWVVSKVERKTEGDISSFKTTFKSDDIKSLQYSSTTKVKLVITPRNNSSCEDISVAFKAKENQILFLPKSVEFIRE